MCCGISRSLFFVATCRRVEEEEEEEEEVATRKKVSPANVPVHV
jgi:hypothetical protein